MRSFAIGCVAAILTGCGVGEVSLGPEPEQADASEYLSPPSDAGADAGDPTDAALLPTDAGSADAGASDASTPDTASGLDASAPDATAGPDAGSPTCPVGLTCVESFPFGEERDTSRSSSRRFDRYSCAPNTDESGPELIYRVSLPRAGSLSAAVREASGVDADVHILSELDADTCLSRGNFDARADVGPGFAYVVIDTFTLSGVEQSGAVHVDLGFLVPSEGPCGMQSGEMPRVNDGGNHLAMPATGAVVLEAHLVTQDEPPPYPAHSTEFLDRHYALSQARSGWVMHRRETWAPLEGGDFHGCGIGSPTLFPSLDEAWYVNMYWTSAARPVRGTRMILRVPGTDRAVVVAAGYETGPGDLNKIGGATEETFFHLGRTTQPWTLGIAVDQSLPLGPRICR